MKAKEEKLLRFAAQLVIDQLKKDMLHMESVLGTHSVYEDESYIRAELQADGLKQCLEEDDLEQAYSMLQDFME
jgi:hypothetical protein